MQSNQTILNVCSYYHLGVNLFKIQKKKYIETHNNHTEQTTKNTTKTKQCIDCELYFIKTNQKKIVCKFDLFHLI